MLKTKLGVFLKTKIIFNEKIQKQSKEIIIKRLRYLFKVKKENKATKDGITRDIKALLNSKKKFITNP